MTGIKGATAAEQVIGDLLDEGLTIRQIVAETGIGEDTVRRIAAYIGRGQADLWMRDARASSYRLLCALRQHHPDQVGSAA